VIVKYHIPSSEIAFFCSINKKLCNNKSSQISWVYNPKLKSTLKYTFYQGLQYKIFLMRHGYTVLSLPYFLGLLSSIYVISRNVNVRQSVKKGIVKLTANKKVSEKDDVIPKKSSEKYIPDYDNNIIQDCFEAVEKFIRDQTKNDKVVLN
jgi:hypothetical protein